MQILDCITKERYTSLKRFQFDVYLDESSGDPVMLFNDIMMLTVIRVGVNGGDLSELHKYIYMDEQTQVNTYIHTLTQKRKKNYVCMFCEIVYLIETKKLGSLLEDSYMSKTLSYVSVCLFCYLE